MTPVFTPFAHDDFVAAIHDLAGQVLSSEWAPQLLVGVGRGGLVPAVFLSHATGLAMVSVDFSTPIAEFNDALVEALAARTRGGERVLFIEDINDSGRTIAAIRAKMARAGGEAANARFAVLVDNLVSAEAVDYRYRTIDRTVTKDWFVFPWEAVAPHTALVADAADVPARIA